jgi:hypothetical protein
MISVIPFSLIINNLDKDQNRAFEHSSFKNTANVQAVQIKIKGCINSVENYFNCLLLLHDISFVRMYYGYDGFLGRRLDIKLVSTCPCSINLIWDSNRSIKTR